MPVLKVFLSHFFVERIMEIGPESPSFSQGREMLFENRIAKLVE